MSENAENVQQDNLPPAEEKQAEPMVPKFRLDEQAQQIRFLQEQVRLQQEALGQVNRQVTQPQDPYAEIEELKDLDPALLRGLAKLMEKKVKEQAQPFRAAIGSLAERQEEQSFVAEFGKEAKKYIPQIRDKRKDYAQRGIPLDFETAYKMIRFDEMESAPKRTQKQEAVVEEKVVAPPVQQKTAAKHFNELSIEDMESQLEGPL